MSGCASSSAALSGFTTAAVLDAHLLGRRPARTAPVEQLADERVDLLRLRAWSPSCPCRSPTPARRRGRSCADLGRAEARPAPPFTCRATTSSVGPPRARRASRPRRRSASCPRLQHRLGPLVHRLVGLAEELPPLGVADDHVGAARRSFSIGARDLAGEGARRLPVAVLRRQLDVRALQRLGHRRAAR